MSSVVLLATCGLLMCSASSAREPVATLLEMRQRNMIIQQWDLSCGAAALATILRFQHGINVSEREVAIEMAGRDEYVANPDLLRAREGFSLLDLKNYVERRRLIGTGLGGLSLDDLLERAPVLVPLSIHGYNHFVVFRDLANNRVLVADPAWGNRTMLVEEFLEAWIDFDNIGHVGFTVTREGEPESIHALSPMALDFVMLR